MFNLFIHGIGIWVLSKSQCKIDWASLELYHITIIRQLPNLLPENLQRSTTAFANARFGNISFHCINSHINLKMFLSKQMQTWIEALCGQPSHSVVSNDLTRREQN